MTIEERIKELEMQEARLQMQLAEVQYVKKGYENTLKDQAEEKTEEVTS